MIYCDASVIVALVVPELYSDPVSEWMQAQTADGLAASPWVLTEVASALAMKRRLGRLNDTGHATAARSSRLLLGSMLMFEVTRSHFSSAGDRFVSTPPAGLRAGDALHLAIVADHGLGLATLDRKFAQAARNFGIVVETIGES